METQDLHHPIIFFSNPPGPGTTKPPKPLPALPLKKSASPPSPARPTTAPSPSNSMISSSCPAHYRQQPGEHPKNPALPGPFEPTVVIGSFLLEETDEKTVQTQCAELCDATWRKEGTVDHVAQEREKRLLQGLCGPACINMFNIVWGMPVCLGTRAVSGDEGICQRVGTYELGRRHSELGVGLLRSRTTQDTLHLTVILTSLTIRSI